MNRKGGIINEWNYYSGIAKAIAPWMEKLVRIAFANPKDYFLGGAVMSYQKAIDILPVELINEIQKYTDGGLIYIPKNSVNRLPWGTNTETKRKLSARNLEIYQDYLNGINYKALSQKYFLDINKFFFLLFSMLEYSYKRSGVNYVRTRKNNSKNKRKK